MRLILIAAAAVALSACNPSSANKAAPAGSEPQPEGAPAPAAPPAPALDWHFMTEGGSADLDFGDGDWAEGTSAFHMSCLPNSKSIEVSLAKDGQATLSSGGQSVTVEADSSTPADGPALAAFRASGSLTVAQGDPPQTFNATSAGKAEVEKFFAYCTRPQG